MESRPFLIVVAIVALSGALFILDLIVPFGVAAGFPYVAVVFAAAWMPQKRMALHLAFLSSALIILGGIWSPSGGVIWMGVANRTMGVAIVWVTAVLILLRRQTEERLRRANRELDGFVRTVSHDLRSPLSPIIAYADYVRLEYGDRLGEDGKNALDEISNHGQRMHALLDDLLQFATAGSLERPAVPVDAERVVRLVLDGWSYKAAQAGCEIRLGQLPPVSVLESLLAQIFDNLIGNAVRYAPGGVIEIGGERTANRVRYHVRDHGPGVAAEEAERIFEIFHRGPEVSVSGTGIGLATIRKIAQHFGGRAWVEETPGGGSTFWVELAEPRR